MTDKDLPDYEEIENLRTMLGITEEMTAAGFGMLQAPEYPCPILRPSDLTHNNMQLFAQKYAQFEGWRSYSHNVMAHIDGWLLEYKSIRDRIATKARVKARHNKRTSEEKYTEKALEDDIRSRKDYVEAADQIKMLEQKRLLTEDVFIRTNNGASVMSRYIEVRKTEAKHEGRHY